MKIKYYTSASLFKSFSVKRKNGFNYRVTFTLNHTLKEGEYITEDAELQDLIEQRPEFKTGAIKLRNTITTKKDVKVEHVDVTPKPVIVASSTPDPVEEVTTWNEAKDYLKLQGIHHMKLRTPEAIREEAKKLGIVFSNL